MGLTASLGLGATNNNHGSSNCRSSTTRRGDDVSRFGTTINHVGFSRPTRRRLPTQCPTWDALHQGVSSSEPTVNVYTSSAARIATLPARSTTHTYMHIYATCALPLSRRSATSRSTVPAITVVPPIHPHTRCRSAATRLLDRSSSSPGPHAASSRRRPAAGRVHRVQLRQQHQAKAS